MKKEEFAALREQLSRFTESDKKNNSVLLIVGTKEGQTVLRVGTALNLAVTLSCAMHSDEHIMSIVKGAVDAYDNVLAGEPADYEMEEI